MAGGVGSRLGGQIVVGGPRRMEAGTDGGSDGGL